MLNKLLSAFRRGNSQPVLPDPGEAVQQGSAISMEDDEDVDVYDVDKNGAFKFKKGPSVPPKLHQFNFVSVIGKGSYAKVVLVQLKRSGKLYACKIMTKKNILKKRQKKNVLHERTIMSKLNHPFIARLHMAFQTAMKVFMVLEFCSGGELYFHKTRLGKFPVEMARFYLAEIILSVEHLHKHQIVSRDIKSENILMDHEGHLKLSDFGLAHSDVSEWSTGAKTACGTPEFMAPEVLISEFYGQSCDWWSVGATFYELVSGLPPYRGKTSEEVFTSVLEEPLALLRSWPEPLTVFIRAILRKDVNKRLGAKNGVRDIVEHRFFINGPDKGGLEIGPLNMQDISEMKIPPPIRPEGVELDTTTAASASSAGNAGNASKKGNKTNAIILDLKFASSKNDAEAQKSGRKGMKSSDPEAAAKHLLNIDRKKLKGTDMDNFDSIFQSDDVTKSTAEQVMRDLNSKVSSTASDNGGHGGGFDHATGGAGAGEHGGGGGKNPLTKFFNTGGGGGHGGNNGHEKEESLEAANRTKKMLHFTHFSYNESSGDFEQKEGEHAVSSASQHQPIHSLGVSGVYSKQCGGQVGSSVLGHSGVEA